MDLFTRVYAFQGLSPQNLIEIASAHTPLHFRKGKCSLQENEQMDGYYILAEGLVRTYVHDANGNDITTDFVSPGQLIIDVVSLFQRVPSRENIVAITDGKA